MEELAVQLFPSSSCSSTYGGLVFGVCAFMLFASVGHHYFLRIVEAKWRKRRRRRKTKIVLNPEERELRQWATRKIDD